MGSGGSSARSLNLGTRGNGQLHTLNALLTTYTHHLELQVIIALSLISTVYKSLAHATSSQASLVVSWQWILTQHTKSLLFTAALLQLTLFFRARLSALN
jgi:hypothetical protein